MDYNNTGLTQVLNDGTNTYLYGNARVAQVGATTQYFLDDALGSVRQMANASGGLTLARSYDPYGTVRDNAHLAPNTAYGFTGEFTESTGMVYLRARHYAPNTGRFMTRDTWDGDNNNPMSFNRWNYTNGNPINYLDPTGHITQEEAPIADQIVERLKPYKFNITVDWRMDSSDIIPGCGTWWMPGEWELNDLETIERSVYIMDKAISILGGNFKGLIHEVQVKPNHGATNADRWYINFDIDNPDAQYQGVIHETGHLVHMSHPGSIRKFMNDLLSYCVDGSDSCGHKYLPVYNPGPYGGTRWWYPQPRPAGTHMPSSYAGTGPNEDFAELFTTVVSESYRGEYRDYVSPIYNYYYHNIGTRRDVMQKFLRNN